MNLDADFPILLGIIRLLIDEHYNEIFVVIQ